MSAKQQIENTAGALVWWDFDVIRVTPAQTRAVLDQHGIQVDVPDIDPKSALAAAARRFRAGASGEKVRARLVAVYDDGTAEVAITRDYTRKGESVVKGGAEDKAGAEQIDSVVYDLDGDKWLYQGKTDHARDLVQQATDAMHYLDVNFIRRHVVNDQIMAAGAFPLRRRVGGFYFVPVGTLETVERVAAAIADLPGDARVEIAHINTSDASLGAVGRSAREHVEHTTASVRERLAMWREHSMAVQGRAIGAALVELRDLQRHAALYRDALHLEIEDLTADVEAALADAEEIMELSEEGVAPGQVAALANLLDGYHEIERTVPLSDLPGLGFSSRAYEGSERDLKWWWARRGTLTAKHAGLRVILTEDARSIILSPLVEASSGEG